MVERVVYRGATAYRDIGLSLQFCVLQELKPVLWYCSQRGFFQYLGNLGQDG